jgi:DNA-binding PadR family transcriptional regulator
MAKRRKVSNLLGLGMLAMLASGRPMHPYEMANLLRRTGKDQEMNIKWGSLYTVVQNLEKYGFITATGSTREGRRPERTVYAITDAGRRELTDWVCELVAVPDEEHSKFEAALSVIAVIGPDETVARLEERLHALDAEIVAQRTMLEQVGRNVARIFLVESEYALAMREAEAAWVRSLLTELAEGTLPGVDEWRHYYETGDAPPQWTQLLEEMGISPD